ncbi:hypothetical protein GAPWKB30_0831 [Gilliamella apicola]|nr:hypothetical protein GAPWKB30_0831 [Gilliamella apicola]
MFNRVLANINTSTPIPIYSQKQKTFRQKLVNAGINFIKVFGVF